MGHEEHDRRIDYIELAVADVARAKAFYTSVFGWKTTDWGDEYASFEDGRIGGGFAKAGNAPTSAGGPLVILYSTDLEAIEKAVRDAGGAIVKEIFPFPGGRRFHFADPDGYVLAVWSDRDANGATIG